MLLVLALIFVLLVLITIAFCLLHVARPIFMTTHCLNYLSHCLNSYSTPFPLTPFTHRSASVLPIIIVLIVDAAKKRSCYCGLGRRRLRRVENAAGSSYASDSAACCIGYNSECVTVGTAAVSGDTPSGSSGSSLPTPPVATAVENDTGGGGGAAAGGGGGTCSYSHSTGEVVEEAHIPLPISSTRSSHPSSPIPTTLRGPAE